MDSYFRAANALYFDAFGRAKAELMGASSWDFIHPVDQHRIVESVDRLITAGVGRMTYRPARRRGHVVIDRLQGIFGFTRTPFGRDLAPGMLHRHTSHGEAVARIGWCVFEHRIGVITGEVGPEDRRGPRRARRPGSHETYDIYLPNPTVGIRGIYHQIVAALGQRWWSGEALGDGQLADCATGALSQNADDISGAPGSMLKTVAS